MRYRYSFSGKGRGEGRGQYMRYDLRIWDTEYGPPRQGVWFGCGCGVSSQFSPPPLWPVFLLDFIRYFPLADWSFQGATTIKKRERWGGRERHISILPCDDGVFCLVFVCFFLLPPRGLNNYRLLCFITNTYYHHYNFFVRLVC